MKLYSHLFRKLTRYSMVGALLGFAALAHAADQAKMSFVAVGVGDDFTLWYQSGGEAIEVDVYAGALSEALSYQGPKKMIFFATEEDAKATVDDVFGSVEIPADAGQFLLVCSAAEAGGDKPVLSMQAVKDAPLAANQYRIHNFTDAKLEGVLGGHALAIEAGGSADISDAAWKDRRLELPVEIGHVEGDGKKDVFYTTVWIHAPGVSQHIFVVGSRANPGLFAVIKSPGFPVSK